MLNTTLRSIEKIIPKKLYRMGQPIYHYLLSLAGAIWYLFPSRKIKTIAVTGTKGKSSTVEILNAILEEAGYKTAVAGTVRFKVADRSWSNLYKMTIPGRFFVQRFLRQAVNARCDFAILEMTSEGAKQSRHRFIQWNALLFTNLEPEHIESHGSYEKYVEAKVNIAKAVARSKKKDKVLVVNTDSKESDKFMAIEHIAKLPYSLRMAQPYELSTEGSTFTYRDTVMKTHLPGVFNISNMLAASVYAHKIGISTEEIKSALEKYRGAAGRVQYIGNQDFKVVVDYAHTPDSLEKIYQVFNGKKRICVLGNTGGGRDRWKRPEMGAIADRYCDEIILTNEDPYDEDPQVILDEMKKGIKHKPVEIIMDRREAIAAAIKKAKAGDAVIITGKGTDPYIMGPKGSKIEWSDAKVAEEELAKIRA